MQLSRTEPIPRSSTNIMFAIKQELAPIQEILQDCFNRIETKTSAMSYFQTPVRSFNFDMQSPVVVSLAIQGQRDLTAQWYRPLEQPLN